MTHIYQSALTIKQHLDKLINQEAINSFGKTLYQGDNANYCISLFQNNLIEPNENSKYFLSEIGNCLLNWSNNNLYNGYFKMEDVHHGTELFLGFLPRYIDLFPEDENAKQLILKVADFIGNWKTGVDNWFDYKKNNFKSWYLGSEGIHENNLFKYNTADHLRLIHITLLAWELTSDERYLQLSKDYSREIADKIVKSLGNVPVAWDNNWKEYFYSNMESKEEQFLAANHHHLPNNSLSGIENLLASGAIYIFGYLYRITMEEVFYKASNLMLKKLLPILTNPYSDVVGANFNYYRHTYSDASFDKKILDLINYIPEYNEDELMLGFPEEQKIRLDGVGNRKDMIYWYNINKQNLEESKEPPTSFFTLLYNISGEMKHIERAFKTGARKIKITSDFLRSGYEHSDSGKLYSSFISGHGRNWGVGTITGCYSPTIVGSDENLGIYSYEFKFLSKTISNGCLPMVRKSANGEVELIVYNFNDKQSSIKFVYKKNNKEFILDINPMSAIKKIFTK